MLAPRIQYFGAHNLKYVEYKQVANEAEAAAHFQEMIARGEEGTILKGCNGTWKDGKPTFQVKFKLEMTVDLEIIDLHYGTPGTKNEKVISAITVKSSDGLVVTTPSNLKEKDMQYVTDNQDLVMGKILTVKCCGLSNDKDGNYSLLHPNFVEIRDDKTTADSLKDIQENEAMIKGLS
jgi:hypothetical protein